jgi:hypothetical protein
MKLFPLTVKVKALPQAVSKDGEIELMDGIGLGGGGGGGGLKEPPPQLVRKIAKKHVEPTMERLHLTLIDFSKQRESTHALVIRDSDCIPLCAERKSFHGVLLSCDGHVGPAPPHGPAVIIRISP